MYLDKWKNTAILGFRVIQLICVSFITSGFIWASSDMLLLYVLVQTPVAPLSVLFMLYGSVGLFLSEISARVLAKGNRSTNLS